MEPPAKRVKRASAEDLYKTCQTGDCPIDVKNKIEGTTLADTLLKIFSSFIYLGGLGIGTGKGGGGSTGYRPLDTTPGDVIFGSGSRAGGTITGGGSVVRPAVPVDPLGPPNIIPVDTVSPDSSSIIPLLEAGSAITPVDVAPDIDPNLPVITSTDPVSDVVSTGGHPSISTSSSDVAIIDVQPARPHLTRVQYSDTSSSPSSVQLITSITQTPEPYNVNVFVDTQFAGDTVGLLEEIPLEPISPVQEFEIQEVSTPPRTSTPLERLERAYTRARELYNRRVAQRPTRNPDFIGQPSRAVVFENPAFDEADISLQFQQDLQALAAPDPDFQDVVRLGRPTLSETPTGHVRISRLGKLGTMRLRSGTRIGQQIHYYYDVSTIDTADTIELRTLGEQSGDASVVNMPAESSFVDSAGIPDPVFPEETLIDDYNEDFNNSQLLLTASDALGDTLTVPTLPPGVMRIFAYDIGPDVFVNVPSIHFSDSDSNISPANYPFHPTTPIIPLQPEVPSILLDIQGSDFYLHPGLYRRKRKRSY